MDAKQQLEKALAQAKKDGANILTPSITTEGLSSMHAVTVEQLQLSANPKEGDVYPHDKNNYIINKQGLEKLSNLAGIALVKTVRTDNQADRQYISYQAGGFIRKADGSVVMSVKTYSMDFEVIEEECREMYQDRMKNLGKDKKPTQWPHTLSEQQKHEWVEDKTRKEVRRRRKYKDQLCETGAQARVKRDLLGLKGTYTKEELQKPFVVIRIVLKPDYDDPEIKKMLTQAAISATGQLFGVTEAPAIAAPAQEPHAQISHEPPVEPAALPNGNDVQDADYTDAEAPESGPPDAAEVARAEFEGAITSSKIEIINKLINQKGYNKKELKKPLENFTDPQLISFYDALVDMPDDDIPF